MVLVEGPPDLRIRRAVNLASDGHEHLALAHELYGQILKPVEAGWKDSKNLIVATNGALGLLPLGLLPTAPAAVKGMMPAVGAPWTTAAPGAARLTER